MHSQSKLAVHSPHSSNISQQTKRISNVLQMYTSKAFLTKNSLFNNLFSSQIFTLSATQLPPSTTNNTNLNNNNLTPEQQLGVFMKLYFNKLTVEENQLYEFTYFHKRDKKMLLFFYVLYFLQNCPKVQMIILQNGDRLNTSEFRQFLTKSTTSTSLDILKQFQNRIKFFRSENVQVYKANLLFLSFYASQNQFLKSVILADINEFESGDKSSLERIYKKIPKTLLVISCKKQIYDYKFIQNSQLLMEQEEPQDGRLQQQYQLHEKVLKNLNKIVEGFKQSYHSYIVPVQQIGITNKNLEETYRSVVIRKDMLNGGRLSEFIFSGCPVQIKAFRHMNA